MKAIFISHNQSITGEVKEILDSLDIRGYTQWIGIRGRGSVNGDPHEGTHTWPELNNAYLTIAEDSLVEPLLQKLQQLDKKSEQQGLRAFVWNIEQAV